MTLSLSLCLNLVEMFAEQLPRQRESTQMVYLQITQNLKQTRKNVKKIVVVDNLMKDASFWPHET